MQEKANHFGLNFRETHFTLEQIVGDEVYCQEVSQSFDRPLNVAVVALLLRSSISICVKLDLI